MSTATRAVKIAFFSSLTAIAICAAPAKADTFTFNFNDEYYVAANKSSTFQSIFGTTAGYSGAGIYQLTNSSTPTVTKLSNGSSVPGEFVENTAPNASEGLQLFGWSQSLNNGQQVANVYNLNNPINGTNTYFQFKTGVTGGLFGNGTTTAFNFDSFDLKGSTGNANLNFTLEGFRNGVLIDSIAVNVTGNTFKTYTENWTNVDTIVVASTCDKTQHICDITLDPQDFNANWGSGTLYMDNVVIDNSVGVPGPIAGAGLPGLIAACGGLLALARRRRQRQAVAS